MAESPDVQYCRGVLAGEIPAGRLIVAACKRHMADLARVGKKSFGFYFDQAAADHAVNFFSLLRHSKAPHAGKPFVLELWQEFIVRSLYGWKRKVDGLRRYRTGYIEIPRKNGKTTLVAGLGLLLMIWDGEAGAEVYCVATTYEQARDQLWEEARRMVLKSPALKKRIQISAGNLAHLKSFSKFEPMANEEGPLHGLNPSGALIDELHVHKSRAVYDAFDTGTDAREQPLLITITTAGDDSDGVWAQEHDYAQSVVKGTVPDDTLFVFIAKLEDDEDWRNEKNWAKANPNLGVSVRIDGLRAKFKKAENAPATLNRLLRLHLNMRRSMRARAIELHVWDACRADIDWDSFRGQACWGGIDLASIDDLTAASLVFKREAKYLVKPMFFLPEAAVERSRKRRVSYDPWVRAGLIEVYPGEILDHNIVIDWLVAQRKLYSIKEVGIDPNNCTTLVHGLEAAGVPHLVVPQNYGHLNDPSKELERAAKGGLIEHDGNAVLRWNIDNLEWDTEPGGRIKPGRKVSHDKKIDGAVSTVLALGRAMVGGSGKSVYNVRGVHTVGFDYE